jgi:hypothetical protein
VLCRLEARNFKRVIKIRGPNKTSSRIRSRRKEIETKVQSR